MEMLADTIVDISESQFAYFGGPGKMLLPSVATVEAMLARIPQGKLITTAGLRDSLSKQFGVQGTCPVTTKKALRTIALNDLANGRFWQVVKANGELLAYFPGGVAGHGDQLTAQGFHIDTSGKAPKVMDFKRYLVNLI